MTSTRRAVDPALLPHERPCWCDECTSAYHSAYYELNADKWSGPYRQRQLERQHLGKSTTISYGSCAAEDCDRCWVITSRRNQRRKWCSRQCRQRQAYRDLAGFDPVERSCSWCFKVFVPKQRRSFYCSNNCRSALLNHWTSHRSPNLCHLPRCIDCGELTFRAFRFRRCHEHDLAERRARASRPATNAKRNANRRRRGTVKAGEAFSVHDLIQRDGDLCRFPGCGRRVKLDVHYLHPAYATIDHIVPISDGGEHTMANCQVMHRGCNSSKGARHVGDPVQLRLV